MFLARRYSFILFSDSTGSPYIRSDAVADNGLWGWGGLGFDSVRMTLKRFLQELHHNHGSGPSGVAVGMGDTHESEFLGL